MNAEKDLETIRIAISVIRNELREKNPNWYSRVHAEIENVAKQVGRRQANALIRRLGLAEFGFFNQPVDE